MPPDTPTSTKRMPVAASSPARPLNPVPRSQRRWVDESHGVIQTWQDFEQYRWPEWASHNDADFEFMAASLPEGMKMTFTTGGVQPAHHVPELVAQFAAERDHGIGSVARLQAEHALQREQGPVVGAPADEVPARAVPQPREQERDQEPAHPAIPIEEGVDGLELRVRQAGGELGDARGKAVTREQRPHVADRRSVTGVACA